MGRLSEYNEERGNEEERVVMAEPNERDRELRRWIFDQLPPLPRHLGEVLAPAIDHALARAREEQLAGLLAKKPEMDEHWTDKVIEVLAAKDDRIVELEAENLRLKGELARKERDDHE